MIIVILSLILFFYIVFKLFKYFSLRRDWFMYVYVTYMKDKITKEKKIVILMKSIINLVRQLILQIILLIII